VSLARSRQALARAEGARAATQSMLLKAPREAQQWRRRLATQSELYKARLRTVEKGEESVRLATLGVKAGTRTHTEVLDAELELFRARAGLVKAQVDAVEALTNLELSLGKPLR